MRKSLLSIPVIAALMVAPMTASADSGWFYISDTKNFFDSGLFGFQYSQVKKPARVSHGKLHHKMDNQKVRIRKGVKSGELTHKEAKKLKNQQHHIARLENRYLSDGRLSRAESRDLNQRLKHASKRIYRKKHNEKSRNDRYVYRNKH
jgi:hypothetical protein